MKSIDPERLSGSRGRRLSATDRFHFRCHAALNCFNQCCRNLNLFLYPYDVVRLKSALGTTSDAFIDSHVDVVLREGNHFPEVLLKMTENPERTCPFLSPAGCTVYADRPDTCRYFPVEHGLAYGGEGPPKPVYFFRPPDFCLGRHESNELTMEAYEADQETARYRDMTRRWAEVKRLFERDPWRGEGPYGARGKMAFMAAYNVDRFRDFVFNSSFRKRFQVRKKALEKAKRGDRAMLLLGFDWIRLIVSGIPSDRIRPR